jgi:hypothetical protein
MKNKTSKKKKVKRVTKVKKDVKRKSFFNKITSGTKNIYETVKKSIIGKDKKVVKKSKKGKTEKTVKTVKTSKK